MNIMILNNKEIESVINLASEKRYRYFINKVSDFEGVWYLKNDGWALASDGTHLVLPVWPHEEYAMLCADKEWKNYTPFCIEIHDFIETYLDDLKEKSIKIGVFYTPRNKGILVEYEKIKDDLLDELSKME
jgi:hypothetical protein